MRWIRLAPMTAESLILCMAFYASCLFQAGSNREPFVEVQRGWGAICPLEIFENHDGVRRVQEPELHGPLDVWNGGWWRIPLTAFHHANLLHLVLTVGAAWYLGRRLEQSWGSFAMGAFLLPAVCVPVMAELALGHAVMGFSGAVCAMLGALVVLRHFDRKVAGEFAEDAAQIGVAILVIGWLMTLLEFVSFPNVAHFAGFIYGALIAAMTSGPLRDVSLLRVSVVLVHIWLIPGLFLVSHPFWIGRYRWYQAVADRNPKLAERDLQSATFLDPSLAGAWLRWSQLAEDRGDAAEAWRRLIDALAQNPTNLQLIDATRRLWRHLDIRQRRNAELVVVHYFGDRSGLWLSQIRINNPAQSEEYDEDVSKSDPDTDGSEFALDRQIELPAMDLLPIRPNQQKLKTLREQNDAVEGETL